MFRGSEFQFKPGDVCDRRKNSKRTILRHENRHVRFVAGAEERLIPEGQFECATVMRDGKDLVRP